PAGRFDGRWTTASVLVADSAKISLGDVARNAAPLVVLSPAPGPNSAHVPIMTTETLRKPQAPQAAHYLRHTRIPTLLFENPRDVDRHVALVVESLIRENNSAGLPTVL